MKQLELINQLANEALSLYPFYNPVIELIRHNENATYKVKDIKSGKQFVMRIHRPIDGFSLGVFGVTGHSVIYLQSELDIITTFRKYTDIPMQAPLRNKYGNLVTVLSDNTPVTVLEWVDGDIIEKAEITNEILFNIGEMTAKMHQYSICNHRSLNFKRYSYDRSILPRIGAKIALAADKENISIEQSRSILSSLGEISRRMDELDLLINSKGIVHSDLSKSNMILHNNKIVPIDFCLCGYSYYYMDLGSLFATFSENNERNMIINGYQSILKREINPWYIEPFFALQVILFIAFQYEKASQGEWFQAAMERWCRDIFEPLRCKKAFIL